MGELYVVRHGEAHKPLESDFGSSYSLTPSGRQRILETGSALLNVLAPNAIDGIECAPTLRSKDTAKLLGGALETSAAITEQDALRHRGVEPARLLFELNKWAFNKQSGVYVCAMSRRAIVGLIAPSLGLKPIEIDETEPDSDIDIPCGSVTHLTVSERGLKVVGIGRLPGELVD